MSNTKRFHPPLASAVLAIVWLVLAWRTPTATHHFAPFVAAAAWGFLASPTAKGDVARAAVGGVAIAALTTVVLLANSRLGGPTLWGARPSWPELLGFGILGGLVTVLRARRPASSSASVGGEAG